MDKNKKAFEGATIHELVIAPSAITIALQTRIVELTWEEVLGGDDAEGVVTAFRYAAHTWMYVNLPESVYGEDVSDAFHYARRFAGVSASGVLHFAIDDMTGNTWHFFGTAPPESLMLPIEPE